MNFYDDEFETGHEHLGSGVLLSQGCASNCQGLRLWLSFYIPMKFTSVHWVAYTTRTFLQQSTWWEWRGRQRYLKLEILF